MQVTVQIPDETAHSLIQNGEDLSRRALEELRGWSHHRTPTRQALKNIGL